MSDNTPSVPKTTQAAQPPAPTAPERFWQPLTGLRDEMDRIFDNFWRGFGGISPRRNDMVPSWRNDMPFAAAVPAVDVVESDKDFRITAELPGLGRDDVDLNLSGNMLTIKGEKKEQREEKAANYYVSERRFGSFRRSFELPPTVKRDGIEASFDKGVLTVTLPKTTEAAQQTRKIEVKSAS